VPCALALSTDMRHFVSIGHTPVYWPLLALFAWLVARERWHAGAVSLGLLLASRSTMVAVVPVLLMAVWLRDRRRFADALVLVTLVTVLPFLPFAVLDAKALVYALYGSYEKVIKAVVWPDATVPHTIGLTGVLLTHHLQRWVETLQVAVMAVVYVACWLGLRRGRAPIALMGLALLAFSMTTLWPVTYIYFDVCLLLAAGVLADMPWLVTRLSTPSVFRGWAAAFAASIVLVAGAAWTMLPSDAADAQTVTWKDDRRVASVLLLRRTASAALVDIQTGPALSAGGSPVQMNVALNGALLGAVRLNAEGDRATLAAPSRLWQIGVNDLEVAVAPPIAIGRVTVRPAR
jgi:hypothetical protein